MNKFPCHYIFFYNLIFNSCILFLHMDDSKILLGNLQWLDISLISNFSLLQATL